MAEEKTYMPSGFGGLIRYTEEEKELTRIKPKQVIWIIVGVTAVELFLNYLKFL